jgi:hypothetical protein
MLEPPEEFYEIVPEDSEIERESIRDASRPLLFEAEWPGMHHKETEHCKTPFIDRIFRSMSGSTEPNLSELDHYVEGNIEGRGSPKSMRCLNEPKVVRKIKTNFGQNEAKMRLHHLPRVHFGHCHMAPLHNIFTVS